MTELEEMKKCLKGTTWYFKLKCYAWCYLGGMLCPIGIVCLLALILVLAGVFDG